MNELRGKRVLVVGLARSGRAAARCLGRRGAVVTVTDSRPPAVFQDVIPELTALKVGLELGFHRTETFLRQDLVVVSPGVPWDLPQLQAARARGIQVVTEVEAASWFLTGRLIGITGTNGKTTTTALLGKMLEASGLPTFVGGNIGIPLISAVDHIQPGTVLVTELSSFQLEAAQNLHPNVAVLLNITPNHLDRHASFQDYQRAKAKIFSQLTPADYAILNADDPNVMSLVPAAAGTRRIFFSRRQNLPDGIYVAKGQVRYRAGHLERPLFDIRDVRLRGAFNLENVLAASAAACVVGADFDALRRAVLEFKGVEHRLEFVRRIRGVDFYNDSKGTSVDATAKALSAFERGVHLILGGKDKGAPYLPLVRFIKGRVHDIFLIGAAADRISQELSGTVEMVHSGDLETAVREAFKRAGPGDVVLLSPACASFDQFRDYEHRGRAFKQIVRGLARDLETGGAGEKENAAIAESPALAGARPGREPRAEGVAAAVKLAAQSAQERARLEQEASQSRAPDPVYVYEVGVEEAVRSKDAGSQAEFPEEDSVNREMASPKPAADEPLPFEVRTPSPRRGDGGNAKSGAGPGGREEPEGSPGSPGPKS